MLIVYKCGVGLQLRERKEVFYATMCWLIYGKYNEDITSSSKTDPVNKAFNCLDMLCI